MQHAIALILTLTTACGRVGVHNLSDSAAAITWDREITDADGIDQTTLARFELVKDEKIVEAFEIDGDAWRTLEDGGDLREVVLDCQTGSIEAALRAQLDVYENEYSHKACEHDWTDIHSCGCDDECPVCGTSISPVDSTFVAGLNDEQPARYIAANL